MNKAAEGPESILDRKRFVDLVKQNKITWDVIVIGGGATGLGIGVDAASRGYKTLLLEQSDFAKGTSSRSTKLMHGGVRYLAQGNIRLVYEALYERGLLLRNAPHLVQVQPFIIPCYSWFDLGFYGIGLKIYDWMAGKYRLKKTELLSKSRVKQLLPNVEQHGLKGGVIYYDGQFDDARLAVNLAQTCAEQGGVPINYFKVTGILKAADDRVAGVKALDLESGEEYQVKARVVINATGVFVNDVLKLDTPAQEPLVQPSQGVHVVLDKTYLNGNAALMIPKTPDGRVLFAIPWHNHVLVGTTDTPLHDTSLEPVALEDEINFILKTAGEFLVRKPERKDVLSVFAGLRPLAAPDKNTYKTKEISRSHKLIVAPSGFITIIGGKWTTYRKMAEDTIEKAIGIGSLPVKPCVTASLKIHGYKSIQPAAEHLKVYGSDAVGILELMEQRPELCQQLHPDFPYTRAEVVWAVKHEMARTVEDVLARRIRILFLNAKAAMEIAPAVATIVAAELGQNEVWKQNQLFSFMSLAKQYLPAPNTAFALTTQDTSQLV